MRLPGLCLLAEALGLQCWAYFAVVCAITYICYDNVALAVAITSKTSEGIFAVSIALCRFVVFAEAGKGIIAGVRHLGGYFQVVRWRLRERSFRCPSLSHRTTETTLFFAWLTTFTY